MPHNTDAPQNAPSAAPAEPARSRLWPRLLLIVVVALAVGVGVAYLANNDETPRAGVGPSLPSPSEVSEPDGSEQPAEAVAWATRDQILQPRDDFGTVTMDERIWIFGGMTGERGNKLFFNDIYDPVDDNWDLGPAMPTARSSLTAVTLDGVVYTMGGSTLAEPYLTVNEALDSATGTWETLSPMPTGRYEHGAVVLDGQVWVIGGNTTNGWTDAVDIFDPATGQWSTGPSLAVPRGSLRTVVHDGLIYAVGGLGADGISDVVEIYDPAVGEWESGPSLPEPILNFGLASYDGGVHAVYHEFHFTLSPGDEEWRAEGSPPIIRHGMGLIELDGLLYAIGGCTEDPLRDVPTVQAWQA